MDREQRRTQILRAAEEVFARLGYHRAGIADIIDRAGVARGTFYLYFESKRHVFEQLLDEFFEIIRSQVRRIDVTRGPDAVVEQIRGNATRVIDAILLHQNLGKILLSDAVGLDEECDEKLLSFYARLLGLIEGALTLGLSIGIVRPCDPRIVALCILGTLKEVLYHGVMKPRDLPRETLAEEILQYNLRGLLNPVSP